MDLDNSSECSNNRQSEQHNTNTDSSWINKSSKCYTECNDSNSSDNESSSENCNNYKNRRRRRRRNSYCESECEIAEGDTPIGIWNLVYSCDEACTASGKMEWHNQMVLHGDNTLHTVFTPDLTNNPFSCFVTPGLGVWKIINERKYKLQFTHLGYQCTDGSTKVYYKIYITCKLNRKGNKLRFCGKAQTYDLADPKLCTPIADAPLCFNGYGVKILEPEL